MNARPILLLALALAVGATPARPAAAQPPAPADSTSSPLEFAPAERDSASGPLEFAPFPVTVRHADGREAAVDEGQWLRAPIGDDLITDPDEWRARHPRDRGEILADYNRVDRLRVGAGWEFQSREPMDPRFGARLEYATGRQRTLYGAQFEQPVMPPGRLAVGVSMVRRTDHNELQQVDNVENSLALLFGRQDYRDYFEREGFGAYIAWRVPDFSTLSAHVRNDHYRSLALDPRTRSWFNRDKPLRDNPAIDEGEAHTVALRSERLMHRTRAMRAGLYHWIDVERAGHGLGGAFQYTRALGDVRSVVRLSPAATLLLRGVAGTALDGTLPVQKRFMVGGVDGLRAHPYGAFVGDRMALGQAEYVIDLWRLNGHPFDGGLQALAFVDSGKAWTEEGHAWSLGRQRMPVDGGVGVGTADDALRVYFARDLQHSDSPFVVTLRLQRPF